MVPEPVVLELVVVMVMVLVMLGPVVMTDLKNTNDLFIVFDMITLSYRQSGSNVYGKMNKIALTLIYNTNSFDTI